MDRRDTNMRDTKTNSELGRHQRVLDAYLAHAGSDSMPPAALDAKLIALAASSLNATIKTPYSAETRAAQIDSDAISSIRTSTRSRRRRWPFALAASVATIGFAAILARNFQDTPGYGEPVYQAPSYEAKSVAADQAPAADALGAVATPAPMQEEMRDQAAPVTVMPAEDKAKLSRAPDHKVARAMEQALGQVAAAPPASPVLAAKSIAAASASPAAEAAAPEVSEFDVQPQRNRRRDVDAAPLDNIPTENGVAETAAVAPAASAKAYEPSAFSTDAKPAPQALAESQTDSADSAELPQTTAPVTRSEAAQAGTSAPLDDAANAKNDELEHAKAYAAIRALRDSGELAQAKAMLARFRKAYPLEIVPDDLKALAKTK